MKFLGRLFLLILWLLFFNWKIEAQVIPYLNLSAPTVSKPNQEGRFVKHWKSKMGLPMNSFSSILIDQRGYKWIASFDGIIRTDGHKMKVFSSAYYPQIVNNRFISVLENKSGHIFFNSEVNRAYGVHARTGELFVVCAPETYEPLFVHYMSKSPEGEIIFATKAGIYSTSPNSTELIHLMNGNTREVFIAYQDHWKTLWFINSDQKLVRYQKGKEIVVPFTLPNTLRFFDLEESDSLGWIGWKNQLLQFSANTMDIVTVAPIYEENSIVSIQYNAGERKLLLGTNNEGFYRYNFASARAEKINIDGIPLLRQNSRRYNRSRNLLVTSRGIFHDTTLDTIYYLESHPITGVVEDDKGSIWISTNGNGIQELTETGFKTLSPPDNANIYPVYVQENGTVWMGTYGNGAVKHDGSFHNIKLHNGIEDRFITTITQLDNETMLFGANSSFIYSVNNNGKANKHRLPTADNQLVSAVFKDSKNNIWVGSSRNLYLKSPEITFSEASIFSLMGDPEVRFIIEAPDSSIWLSSRGAGLIQIKNDIPKYIYRSLDKGEQVTRAITIDPTYNSASKYVLWVGTESQGLHRLLIEQDTVYFSSITTENGLLDNTIHQVLFDEKTHMWMSSNRGLSRLSKQEIDKFFNGESSQVKPLNFFEEDGLPNNEFNGGFQSTAFSDPKGNLYFGNQQGLVYFNPEDIISSETTPNVQVEDIYVDDKPLLVSESNQIFLEEGIHSIKIYVTDLGNSPKTSLVWYKLNKKGAWLSSEIERAIVFPSLGYGDHEISLALSSTPPLSNDGTSSIFITIAPFWYQSVWFYALLTVFAIGLMVLFIRIRFSFVTKKNERLEQLVEQRSKELQLEQERNLMESKKLISDLKTRNELIKNVHSIIQQPSRLLHNSLQLWFEKQKEALTESAVESLDELIKKLKTVTEKLDRSIEVVADQESELRMEKEAINVNDLLHSIANALTKKSLSIQSRSSFLFAENAIYIKIDSFVTQIALTDIAEYALADEQTSVFCEVVQENNTSGIVYHFSGLLDSKITILQQILNPETLPSLSDFPAESDSIMLLSIAKRIRNNDLKTAITIESDDKKMVSLSFTAPSVDIKTEPKLSYQKLKQQSVENPSNLLISVFDSSKDYTSIIEKNLLADCTLQIMSRNGVKGYAKSIADSDLVLIDADFSYVNPFKLIEVARAGKNGQDVTVAMMSATYNAKDQMLALKTGADMYITKSLADDTLVSQINALITFRQRLSDSFNSHSQNYELSGSTNTNADKEFMERVTSIIRQNISNSDFNVGRLSSELNYNRSSLSKRVKKLVDKNPSEIVQELRMIKAIELLQSQAYNISEVAYACGFNSLSYFSQAFKAHTGKSPSDWVEDKLMNKA